DTDIIAGVSKTAPFEHRLKPSRVSDAWLIDDTYNGNVEGMKAGLALLEELPGKRKVYVTPGLVEQGTEKEQVHKEIAQRILSAAPDEVVLMRNSATTIIMQELQGHNFSGILRMEDDPLAYYESLPYKISSGDVVLMQNDWTDNYN